MGLGERQAHDPVETGIRERGGAKAKDGSHAVASQRS